MKSLINKEERKTWGVAAGVSVVIIALVLALVRFGMKPTGETALVAPSEPAVAKVPKVGLTRLDGAEGDTVLQEEALFFDPTPLFLPTEWNVAQNTLPDNLIRGSGQIFQNYAPKLTFGETDLTLSFPPPVLVPAKPAGALAMLEPDQPFAGMGRTERKVPELAARGAVVEITAAGDGRRQSTLTVDTAGITAGSWRPLEFLVEVNAAGLVGPPVLIAQSGVEEVDGYFQNLLVKTLHVGERLAPGAYRICVGP